MKEIIAKIISKETKMPEKEIITAIEKPTKRELGDYSYPYHKLAKKMKKNHPLIAEQLTEKIRNKA